jgi:propanol-preferring alcohol dehydrogenase
MKAQILERYGSIESSPLHFAEVPDPIPKAGEILIDVEACAICRTDLHIIENELKGEFKTRLPGHPIKKALPLIPGHQVVGRVIGFGSGTRRFKIGDRVGVAWLRSTDQNCEYCRSGRENLCEAARFTGYSENGGYAEKTTAPEEFVYPLPNSAKLIEIAPLLCAGIIGYRALKRAQLPERGTLGLFGFGSSAHILIQLAVSRGAEVYVIARDEKHRQLARKLGARFAGENIRELPVLLDSAILFAPVGEMVPASLRALKKGGTLSLAGIHMTPIPSLDYEKDLFFEKNLCSVTANTRNDGRELLEEAFKIPIRPHVILYPLSDANRALQDLKADRISGTGVLIRA